MFYGKHIQILFQNHVFYLVVKIYNLTLNCNSTCRTLNKADS